MSMVQKDGHEPKSYLGVMVSSTFLNIPEHRAEAIRVIEERQLFARVMERDSAKADTDVIESSLNMVRDSAAYIGVITHKYGQTPQCPERNPDGLSLTELEFNESQRLGRPTLLFIMGEHHKGERADFESDPGKIIKLEAFRSRAKRISTESPVERVYATFETLDEFKDKAGNAIAGLAWHLASHADVIPHVAPPLPSIDQQEPCPEIYGREEELESIVNALILRRPVVIAGGPGFGKTALASKAMYDPRLISEFGRRRILVSYESASEPRDILARIVDILGLTATGDEIALLRQIESATENGEILVLADNLDPIFDGDRSEAERILRLAAQHRGLTLLSTIRGLAPLIPGGFAIEDLGKLNSPADVNAFSSIAGDSFATDPDLFPLLDALDGHALSIQLIAAQARGLASLSGIRESWEEEHAAILKRPGEDEGRLNSVRASLQVSLRSNRLSKSPLARRLLAMLSHLPVGLAETDVRAVLGERGTVSKVRAMEAVTALNQLRLVERRLDRRLRMLNPLRESAKLDLPVLRNDRERLEKHYLDIAILGRKRGTELWDEARRILEVEGGNLEELCNLALAGRINTEQYFSAMLGYTKYVSVYGGAIDVIIRSAEKYKDEGEIGAAAFIMQEIGDLYIIRSDIAKAQDLYTQARALAHSEGRKLTEAHCIYGQAKTSLAQSNINEALDKFDLASRIYHELKDTNGFANCLFRMGTAFSLGEDRKLGISYFDEAAKIYSDNHDLMGIANVILRRANLEEVKDENALQKALSIYRSIGAALSLATCLVSLGDAQAERGDADGAIPWYKEAQTIARRAGDVSGEAFGLVREGQCLRQLGNATEGLRKILEGLDIWLSTVPPSDKIYDGWVCLRRRYSEPAANCQKYRDEAARIWREAGRFDLIRLWIDFLPET